MGHSSVVLIGAEGRRRIRCAPDKIDASNQLFNSKRIYATRTAAEIAEVNLNAFGFLEIWRRINS